MEVGIPVNKQTCGWISCVGQRVREHNEHAITQTVSSYGLQRRATVLYEHACVYAGSGPNICYSHRAASPLPCHGHRVPTPEVARSSREPGSSECSSRNACLLLVQTGHCSGGCRCCCSCEARARLSDRTRFKILKQEQSSNPSTEASQSATQRYTYAWYRCCTGLGRALDASTSVTAEHHFQYCL